LESKSACLKAPADKPNHTEAPAREQMELSVSHAEKPSEGIETTDAVADEEH
jgi:hypothetical protein